jgi:hypothetical protein
VKTVCESTRQHVAIWACHGGVRGARFGGDVVGGVAVVGAAPCMCGA